MAARRRQRMIVVGLLLLGLLVAMTPSWGDFIGEVVHTEGKTELQKSQVQQQGSDTWEKLAYKGTVFLLDTIRTGPKSTAETLLEYQELDTVWTLFENGKIHFTEEEAICEMRGGGQPQQRIAYLDEGDVRGVVSRQSDNAGAAEVRTNNAVICATGTIFIVRFIPPNTTVVIVLEGTVLVRTFEPASGWVEVETGFRTEVVDTQPPAVPVRLSVENLQRARRRRVVPQIPGIRRPTQKLPEYARLEEHRERQRRRAITSPPTEVPGDPIIGANPNTAVDIGFELPGN